jgi:hypothetical protein
MSKRTVFVCADHGLAVFYFLQSDLIQTFVEADLEVILLTEDNTREAIQERYGRPGLVVEGLRLDRIQAYMGEASPSLQWWLDFLRRAGSAGDTNLAVVDSYVRQVKSEAGGRRKNLFPVMEAIAGLLRRSRPARRALLRYQSRFNPMVYSDLFDKYVPQLVLAASPGFRLDRFLLREAAARGIMTSAAIISWDSSSSYGLCGGKVDWITCWSEIQKQELIGGADWMPERVNVGGMPPYDGYVRREWLLPRDEYFAEHGLDPDLKLLSYASSFVSWSPNLQNVEALVNLVASDRLIEQCQLLIRLHPIHMSGHYRTEANRIRDLAAAHENVHIVEPVPLATLGHYSGEDVAERTSMMAHSDIFLTVYSTMCVEASFQERPIVSVCIDSPTGWPGRYWVPMSQIHVWPTHSRFYKSGAGRTAFSEPELIEAINHYLAEPDASREAQRRFLEQECTYLDGSAGRRTATFFLSLLDGGRAWGDGRVH